MVRRMSEATRIGDITGFDDAEVIEEEQEEASEEGAFLMEK